VDESIGVDGMRLTRDEAFGLVRDAVNAVASGEDPVPSESVRAKAFALLGRDSESLSPRNFARILKDAHDAGLLDLRKRGEAFEVTAVAAAPSIADQLAVAEEAHKPVVTKGAPAPRGMGRRGGGERAVRGASRAAKAVPAGLLLLGMVEEPAPAKSAESVESADSDATSADAADAASEEKPKKTRAKKAATKSATAKAAPKAKKPRAKKKVAVTTE
jgi:hypothetical protein